MKTKIGVSVGLLGSAVYFVGLVGGWIPLILIAGYVLLSEADEWLRMSAIKAVAIYTFFSVASAIVGLIPNLITIINNMAVIFDSSFSISSVTKIVALISSLLLISEKVLLLSLGFKALDQGTVNFGVIDRLIEKHTQKNNI